LAIWSVNCYIDIRIILLYIKHHRCRYNTMAELKSEIKPDDRLTESLLQVNRLQYRLPPEIGVARAKTVVVDHFQESKYVQGRRMVLDAQTGSSFIDARNSWLEFTLVADGTDALTLGSGSAMNVIDNVLIKGRGGREVCRIEKANLFSKFKQQWENPLGWTNSVGPNQGYATITSASVSGTAVNVKTPVERRFAIPLSALAPVFDQDKLLPAQMMEGLRMELTLATVGAALVQDGAATDGSYYVENPEVHWAAVDLSDQFKRKINEISAQRGLNLMHKEWYHQETGGAATTTYDFDIRKAASKALKSMTISRVTASIDSELKDIDGMNSEAFLYTRAQSHIGADYFPQQAMTGSATNWTTFYQHALSAWGKMSATWSPPTTTYANYGAVSASHCISLNKSGGVSDLDGYQVNNSRALVHNFVFEGPAVARTLDSYLQHVRLLQIFPSSILIKD